MFKELSSVQMQRIIYSMNISKEFKRGQVVFKEGETNISGIYLISDGEFEICKLQKKNKINSFYSKHDMNTCAK